MPLSEDFLEVRQAGYVAFARAPFVDWVREAFDAGMPLHEAAALAPGAQPMRGGRGTVYLFDLRAGRAVVRRYQRGGGMRFLGDRYLRLGTPRPVQETIASEAAIRRGIRTARVMAGSVYPSGAFYRADLVTEFVPSTTTLAALLSGKDASADERIDALRGAGRLIVRMAGAGVRHADLNAGNILLQRTDRGYDPVVLDLDRMFVGEAPLDSSGMLARLERSLKKRERQTGTALSPEEWKVLRASAGQSE